MRAPRLVPVVVSLGLTLGLSSCGSAVPRDSSALQAKGAGEPAATKGRADVDYIAIGPRVLLEGIEPLLLHREARGLGVERVVIEDLAAPGALGAPPPERIAEAIRQIASRAGKRLRFVLLVGDAPGSDESAEARALLPTFYRPKLGYENHRPDEHAHEGVQLEHEHRARRHGEEDYATDLPYALAHVGASGQPDLAEGRHPAPLAVGRVPARTPDEARDFARKVIGYETSRAEGAWRRSIALFSGPANFGALADFLIESTMTRLLDDEVPYDWDVDVVFPKLGSPYAYPFRDLSARLVERLDAGALIAGYVGHGASTHFDDVHFNHRHYHIGTAWDLARLRIVEGKPFFVSITCNTGYYDLPYGRRSVAEALVLNPEGAIAAFASSRESHPYPNALYGEAIVKTFVDERAPTIGEGVVTVKRRMQEGEVPLAPLLFQSDPAELAAEHEGLYNLLGDPATVLRYPARAVLSVEGGGGARAPGAEVTISIESKEIPSGKALLTVETRRSVVRAKVPSEATLRAMPEEEAWAVMRASHAAASDKVVSRAEGVVAEGRASFRVKMPAEPGEYAIKVFASGSGDAAMGHTRLTVAAEAR
ncbi:C25 family cysteine peptidase [Polyangium spumosum]|nr:C25 family cysteine peptidase [Polyangium spumosum]